MDSINKQQPEENKKNLNGSEAAKKIKELAEIAKSCFFCTGLKTGGAIKTRPMAIQKVDDEGILWFLSASDSHKNAEIKEDPSIQIFLQGSSYTDYMTLYGTATISKSKEKIEELWEPMVKNWFTGGKDDPRITVIKFEPETGYYWDTKNSIIVSFAKQIAGVLTGQTMDDSIEGLLKL